jgi:MFS family permease
MTPAAAPRAGVGPVPGAASAPGSDAPSPALERAWRAPSPNLLFAAALSFAVIAQTTVSLLLLVVPVLAPEIAKGRGLDVHLITFYFPIIYITAIFSNLLAPMLLPRLGGAGYSLLCIAVGSAGLLLFLPTSLPLTLAATVVLGLANGGATPATSQVVGPHITARTAGLIMSVRQSGLPAGGMLAGLVVPIAAAFWGWRALVEIALACVALAILLLPGLRWLNHTQPSRPPAQRPWQPLKRLLAMPDMPQMLFAVFACLMLLMCVRAFFTIYMVRDLGFSLATGGLALAAAQFAGIPGAFVCAVVSDRWLAPRVVLAANSAAMTAATLLAATFSHRWPVAAILAVAAVLGFSASGTPPVMLGEIARRAPRSEVGMLVSGGNLAIMAGSAVGPLVFGAAAPVFGYSGGFVAIALFTLAAAIVAAPLSVGPAGRRREN